MEKLFDEEIINYFGCMTATLKLLSDSHEENYVLL